MHVKFDWIKHVKQKKKSYESRSIQDSDRITIGEKISGSGRPEVYWHKKLQELEEVQFQSGHLKDMPKSKNIVRQLTYEYRKSMLPDLDISKSSTIFKKELEKKRTNKCIDSFIQLLNSSPLLVGLWTKQEVKLLHELGSIHSLVATSNIATKMWEKRIFYFGFVIYNKDIRTEPVPILEVLTDCPDKRSLTCLLTSLLRDEQKCFGLRCKTIPLLCTVDLSWPLIRTILTTFNKESLEDDLDRSLKIVTGKTSLGKLPVGNGKEIFIHICLAHFMKAVSYQAKK